MSNVRLKGFDGLATIDNLLYTNKDGKTQRGDLITYVQSNELEAGKYQPRVHFDEGNLQELAESIRVNGIIQPLIVRPIESTHKKYEIIAGERRWRASMIAGLAEVPVIIRVINDETALGFALIENVQREELGVVEQAKALMRLKKEFDLTYEQIAKRVGWPRTSIVNILSVLTLDHYVLTLLESKEISHGHAKLLFSLKSNAQVDVAKEIIRNQLSVARTRSYIDKLYKKNNITSVNEDSGFSAYEGYEKKWHDLFKRPVKCAKQGDGIKVTLLFDSLSDAEEFFLQIIK